MTIQHYFQARTVAGRVAVVTADENTAEVAADLVCGLSHGFICASAEMIGWDRVLREINELAAAARAPAEKSKPMLRVVNKGRDVA